MFSLNSLALLSLAAISSLAAPAWQHQGNQCLSWNDADLVAQKFGELIATYTDATADAILTPNFTDYSESVNTLINSCPQGDLAISLPLLAPTFTSLAQFKGGQAQQPPINFERLQLWHSCNSVMMRWKTTNTANITDVKPVVGLIIMETVPAPAGNIYPYQIDRVFSEFDAGAWLQNLQEAGICGTNPTEPVRDPSVSQPVATATQVAGTPTLYGAVVPTGTSVVHEAPVRARLMV